MRRLNATAAAKCALLLAAVCSAGMLGGCVSGGGSPSSQSASEPSARVAATASAVVTPTPPATTTVKPAAKPKPPKASSAATGAIPSDNSLLEWNFQRNKKHTVPEIPSKARLLAKRYGAMYVGPDPKLVYLTFDEGYENGNTHKILDTLKRDHVAATFFVTGDYCREAPKLCRRMLAEGHVVGSHSNTHPSMPTLTGDPSRFNAQLTKADNSVETRRFAMNVDPEEGNLATVDGKHLASQLEGVKYQYEQASLFQSTASELAGYNLGEAILYGLVLLLIGEQILAWSASYHPARRGVAQAEGGGA